MVLIKSLLAGIFFVEGSTSIFENFLPASVVVLKQSLRPVRKLVFGASSSCFCERTHLGFFFCLFHSNGYFLFVKRLRLSVPIGYLIICATRKAQRSSKKGVDRTRVLVGPVVEDIPFHLQYYRLSSLEI